MFIRLLIALFAVVFLFSFGEARERDTKLEFPIGTARMPIFAATFQKCVFVNSSNPTNAAIILSDGSRWIIKNKHPEIAYAEISQNWWVGEDIRIKENPGGGFVLRSVSSPMLYEVELDPSFVSTYSIDRMDENGYALLTNDGSEWAIGWLGAISTQYWQPGDCVIINKSYFHREEDYLIINLRAGTSCWTSLISWR